MLSGKHTQARDLSASHEHYLRAIWEVRSRRGYARVSDVARELGVAPPTLSVGLKPLEARGLIAHDDQRFLVLTTRGERVARQVHHRFAVTHAFLRDVLGVSDPGALNEACLLEHDLSEATTERLLDLVKLIHADPEVAQLLRQRLSGFRRNCRPSDECATCDLACLEAERAAR
jgi:DtxR family transcriptional regulator, Mn-dependent transcriptional regulator